jgi:uncharacterized RDD family membrane protein YckC
MTEPESVSARHPAQPPVPFEQPLSHPSEPPASASAPAHSRGPAPVASWASALDPAPTKPRVRAAASEVINTLVLTFTVYGVLRVIAFLTTYPHGGGPLESLGNVSLVAIPLASAALQAFQLRTRQQTRGKKEMRISVVDARTGRAVLTRQAAIRSALFWACVLVSLGFVGLAWDFIVAVVYVVAVDASGGVGSGLDVFWYGVTRGVLSPLGFAAPAVWIVTRIMLTSGDRRTPWDRAAGTTVVTAQSVWWAENGVPNPRLVSEQARGSASPDVP